MDRPLSPGPADADRLTLSVRRERREVAANTREGRYGPMTDPYRPFALRVSPFRVSAYFTARIRLSEGDAQTARASPKPEASRVRACQSAEGMSPSACSP